MLRAELAHAVGSIDLEVQFDVPAGQSEFAANFDVAETSRAWYLARVYGAEAILPTDLEYGSPRLHVYTKQGNQEAREDSID